MCLILFAYRVHERYPLVVAANRDEWFRRPTQAAHFWDDPPGLLAGRDLEEGGTWLGITRSGRFAALTNYRDPSTKRDDAPSRGALPLAFLSGNEAPFRYVSALRQRAAEYNGFNLLTGDARELAYLASPSAMADRLQPGLYGLSNGVLDEPWPKVVKGKEALARVLEDEPTLERLLALLKDHDMAPDHALPATGISLEWERRLSAMHILMESYGTRSATALLVAADGGVQFVERTFDAAGTPVNEVRERFAISA